MNWDSTLFVDDMQYHPVLGPMYRCGCGGVRLGRLAMMEVIFIAANWQPFFDNPRRKPRRNPDPQP